MDAPDLWHLDSLTGLPVVATIASVFFLSALGYAAHRDLRTLTIPNGLILALFLGWSVLAPVAGLAPRDMALSIGAAAMVFFASVALYAIGWMGGGDSKLLTVTALWLGAGQVVPFLMATMLAGGGLALTMVTLRLVPRHLPWPARIARLHPQAFDEVPYALAIGLGALCIFPRTLWMGAL